MLRRMLKQVEARNSKKLGSAAEAVLQYATKLITGFSPLVITAGILKRVKTDSSLT